MKLFQRKNVWVGLLTAGVFFLMGFLGSSQLPKVRSWILVKIEQTSRDHLPVRLLPGGIEVNFFPLGTTLKNVKIIPKKDLESILDPLEIESVSLSVSPWQLLQGRLRLTTVNVTGARISARIPSGHEKAGPPLEGLFKTVASIPLNRIELERIALKVRTAKPRLKIDAAEVNLSMEKRARGSLWVDLNASSIYLLEADSRANVRIDLESTLLAAPEGVTVSAMKIRRGDSFVVASGELKGDTESLDFKTIDLSSRSELHLESMRNWAVKTFPEAATFPLLKGRAFLEGKLIRKNGKQPEGDFKARTEGLAIDHSLLDRVTAAGTFRDGSFRIPQAVLDHPSGLAKVSNLSVKTDEVLSLEGDVAIESVQLHDLLISLGVPEIPLWLQFKGGFPCRGQLKPFTLTCRGSMQGENLLLRDKMKSKGTIVALRQFDAKGEFTVESDKVSYATELKMPNSKGRSQGVVTYATGFKIGYEADNLLMKDVANLADLRLEGAAKIKGTTEGDSHSATMKLDLDGSDLWLEDFWLGHPRGVISYKSGDLLFNNVSGHYTVSRYNGDVKIDLFKHEINVTGRAPFFDARDMLQVFSRKFHMPVAFTGTGQAQIRLSGPLEFTKLSYDLKSSLFRGSVAGETFDQATFDVKAKSGEVTAERVQLTKGPAVITLTGSGHPDGTIQTLIHGRGLRLEDANTVMNSGLTLSGLVDFDMTMKGPVLAPDTNLQGALTKTSIGDQVMPDSHFRLKFTRRTIEGGGDFLGDVVKADFVLPFEKEAPFSLKLSSRDWNFAPAFAAVSGPDARRDYEGRLTADIDISSDSGGFWNSSGQIKLDKLSLSRGPLHLRSTEPVLAQMKSGQVHVQQFNLQGDNTFLKVTDSTSPVSKLDLQVNGKLDMNLLALVTPFFEDLRGILSFAFNVRAGPGSTELLGSAYVEKGYLKLFDFAHPFEDISADILFNQRKVLFNTLRSEFGGGRITASGSMDLKGYKNYPLNVTGAVEKATLNIPDKVQTTGSGTFSVTGHWFPFLLKGDYQVHDGLFSKEFGGETAASGDGIRRSYFLPEILLQDSFVPLLVDLNVDFHRGIQVKNEMMNGRVLGELAVKGNPTKPSVLGSLTTDKDTKITFRDTEFEVTSANVQFADPNEINPRLTMQARTRVQDHDITLLIQGTGSKPDLVWSSVPPLPEKDIISLLALGATDVKLNDQITSQEQMSSTGLQIASGVLAKNVFSKDMQKDLGVDVQFSAGYDDTNNAVQKIIVSRQVTPKFGITGSQSIGKNRETEAKMRYRLNDRLSVVGSYQGRQYDETSDSTKLQQMQTPNKFGLDLEYKFEFR